MAQILRMCAQSLFNAETAVGYTKSLLIQDLPKCNILIFQCTFVQVCKKKEVEYGQKFFQMLNMKVKTMFMFMQSLK